MDLAAEGKAARLANPRRTDTFYRDMISTLLPMLAQAANPNNTGDAPSSWAPVVLLILIGIGVAVGSVVGSLLLGPSRTGPGKSATYESGMTPIGTTRRRFNVRFYIVAMIFLVIDVDIVFFYPWATLFPHVIRKGTPHAALTMLIEMIMFVVILLVAYLYAWGKGVFRWD